MNPMCKGKNQPYPSQVQTLTTESIIHPEKLPHNYTHADTHARTNLIFALVEHKFPSQETPNE